MISLRASEGLNTPGQSSAIDPAHRERRAQGFERVMAEERTMLADPVSHLQRVADEWSRVESAQRGVLSGLGPEMRSAVKLQLDVQRLTLETTLITKAGETLSGTLSRLQQMGGS